jgi:hypothetical protein
MSDIEKKDLGAVARVEHEPQALKSAIRKLDLIFLPTLTIIYWVRI